MSQVEDPMLPPKKAGDYIGQSESTWKKGRAGKGECAALPFYRIGRAIRYRQADLDAFLADRRVEVAP